MSSLFLPEKMGKRGFGVREGIVVKTRSGDFPHGSSGSGIPIPPPTEEYLYFGRNIRLPSYIVPELLVVLLTGCRTTSEKIIHQVYSIYDVRLIITVHVRRGKWNRSWARLEMIIDQINHVRYCRL